MKNKKILSMLVLFVLVFSLAVVTVIAHGFYTPEEFVVEITTSYCDLELTIALNFDDFGIDPSTLDGAVVIKIPTYGEPIIFYSIEEYEAHTNRRHAAIQHTF